jgi:hypothetical protein
MKKRLLNMSRKELRDYWIEKLKKAIYLLYPFTDIVIEYDGYKTLYLTIRFSYKGENLGLQRSIFEPWLVEHGEETIRSEVLTIQRIITEKMLETEVRENDTSTEKK